MVAADALAIVVGHQLGTHLPERTVRIGAAAAFVIFGVLLLVEAAREAERVLDAIASACRSYCVEFVSRISTTVGPWTPMVRSCSMSPVRLGPVTNTRLDGRRPGRPVSGRSTSDGLRTTQAGRRDAEVHRWQEAGRAGAHRGAVEHHRSGGRDECDGRRDAEVGLGARLAGSPAIGADVDAEAGERGAHRRLAAGSPDTTARRTS